MGDSGVLFPAWVAGVLQGLALPRRQSFATSDGPHRWCEKHSAGGGMSHALQGEERVAAFFDIDGTLMAGPSLERRFLAMLRYRHAFAPRNYFSWVAHAIRLAPKGIGTIVHANKM